MKKAFTLIFLISIFYKLDGQTLSFESTFHDYSVLERVDKAIIADLNGDELPDFIVSWEVQRKLYIGLNNGLGKPNFILIDEDSQLTGLTTVDLDLDGDLDFVGAAPFENTSFWWENDGDANFTKRSLSIEDYAGIHFADLDGDNQPEAIISIDDGLHIYTNNSGVLVRQSTLFEDFFGDNSLAIQTFDNNADGLVDIAATFNRNGIIVYQQTGNLNFTTIEITDDLFNQSSLYPTDINQDGGIDFISHSVFTGTSSVITNNNDGTYTVVELPRDGRNEFTTVGDIDGDGDDDILYFEETSVSLASLSVLINNEGEFTEQIISEEYSGIPTGRIVDLNSDEKKEIVVFSNSFFSDGFIVFENTSSISTSTFNETYQELRVFPNLINSNFYIETKGAFTYTVINANGKEITRGKGVLQATINSKNWRKGTYFISIQHNGISRVKQLIKIN